MQRKNNNENAVTPTTSNRQEVVEFLVFLLLGSFLWFVVAYKALRFLKFPFHAHPIESYMIFCVPILLLGVFLKLAQRITREKQD
jgi:pilus assembly protein TadC